MFRLFLAFHKLLFGFPEVVQTVGSLAVSASAHLVEVLIRVLFAHSFVKCEPWARELRIIGAPVYRVTCKSCGHLFDAEAADECSCLERVRTVVCPECASCFCACGRKVVAQFWDQATPAMWQRRISQRRTASKRASPEVGERNGRPVVLFADDDPVARLIAEQVIRAHGCEVVLAENGARALDLARTHMPDLVITDALMPGRDGREVARELRAIMPSTKFVIISSVYKDARYKYEALRHFGADDYIPKPITPGQLRAVLDKHLK